MYSVKRSGAEGLREPVREIGLTASPLRKWPIDFDPIV